MLFSDWLMQIQYFIREPYLSYPEATIGPPWLGGGSQKVFKWMFSGGWKTPFLRLVFATTVVQKRAMLLIFCA